MKKGFYVLLTVIISFSLLFWGQSYLGFNISAGELFGKFVPCLKAQVPKNLGAQDNLKLKPYVQGLHHPRFMFVTENGDLLVAESSIGNIVIIPYKKPDQKKILISDLNEPTSMDLHEGYLYIAEENAIGRIQFDVNKLQTVGNYERLITNLPTDGGHSSRTIKFGPDGYGYVSIGSSCNVCIEKNELRASISRFKPGDDHLTLFATGLRNSVGFDWSPIDGQLYATENGRDLLGDHIPPEELNLIKPNHFYGWPYAYGNRVPDPNFGKGHEQLIKESEPPVFEFAAHQAPLGITFIKNPKSPWYKKALVALHGSWNSSVKVGYKVIILSFENGTIRQEDFLTGFLKNGKVSGRPVQVVEGKDGKLYLSDDFNGIVYLIEGGK